MAQEHGPQDWMLTMGQDGLLRSFREAFHGGLQPLAPLLCSPRLGAQRLDLVPGRLQRLLRRNPYTLLRLDKKQAGNQPPITARKTKL